ncbi:nucleotidyltransferase family protein [Rhizobium sp. 2MFCol3.1]|uniref:nucleotidyltransferase family protein n=1 Tax=Rhizobium sp. 2MFCol3.1 TaxID=1246459 RepID=UPI0003730827|nr:nucleotidyltransferase family protein [Rhizobium sp. 2MFCol3.1]
MTANDLSVSGILLAAGAARRMGPDGYHKLLAEFDGVPLVKRIALRLLAADLSSAVVVIGHRSGAIRAALQGVPIDRVLNETFELGMASSLVCGLKAGAIMSADGVLIALADMPAIETEHLDMLIEGFRQHGGQAVIRATSDGRRGNPAILPRSLYGQLLTLEGDEGARAVIQRAGVPVVGIEIGEAAHLDVDTQQAVVEAGGRLTI